MSLDDLRIALDALDEPTLCEGTVRITERLAVMLPDGDVAAVDDPHFVSWLVEHGEPAPFGLGDQTILDTRGRHATRVVARGESLVSGFDLATILEDIEQVLSPRMHLDASLTDVLVYPPGGHFVEHKDTPRSREQLGTLVVELPIAHVGGAFTIVDRTDTHVVDWSAAGDPKVLRWVALFGDADHAVLPVKSGTRVTLVYSLVLSGVAREDETWLARLAAVRTAARGLQFPAGAPVMIGCTRHVIQLDGRQPQSTAMLRGTDRTVADALVSVGLSVAVRTCIAARRDDYDLDVELPWKLRDLDPSLARLARPLLDEEVAALLECVTFEEPWGADGGGYLDEADASSLRPYLVDTVPVQNWVMRRNAAATFLRTADHAPDGFIGNGADSSYLYKLAALEVTRR